MPDRKPKRGEVWVGGGYRVLVTSQRFDRVAFVRLNSEAKDTPVRCDLDQFLHGLSTRGSRGWWGPVRKLKDLPPRELLDPEGEGIYLHDDGSFPSILMRAALILFGEARRWNEIDFEGRWMCPDEDGEEWFPAKIGRWPRGWRLNLPRRWTKIDYFTFCAPKAGTQ